MRSIETEVECRRDKRDNWIWTYSFVSLTNGVIFKGSICIIANVIVKIRRA